MDGLRISIIQSDIAWENVAQNLENYLQCLLPLQGKSDLAVMPEMCTTGFSMDIAFWAELDNGQTMQTIRSWAQKLDLAIAGSFVAKDINGKLFNRGFFVTPNGDAYFADKRHLFRISGENRVFTAGTNCPVISYKAWNIRLIVCYDLRFPVWIRNKNNEYDLLLCVANWPTSRATIWKVLLQARAIENLCYVCGVNRIGTDHNGIQYQGDSVVLDFKGDTLLATEVNKASVATTTISQTQLQQFRQKFPVWQDADAFKIEEN